MEHLLQYAPLVLMIITFVIQYKIVVTPTQLGDILKGYVTLEHLRINYVSKADMEIERTNLFNDVKREFLEKVEFRQFEQRVQDNFAAMERRLTDSSASVEKRFDKLDGNIEKIQTMVYELSKKS